MTKVREHNMNNTNIEEQRMEESIYTLYKGRRGVRHAGWHNLQDANLLNNPEVLSRIVIGQINSGTKVCSTACRIGKFVSDTLDVPTIWRWQFDVGQYLIMAAVHSGLYEVRRGDGSAPKSARSTEPYRIYKTGSLTHNHKNTYIQVGAPFDHWTAAVDDDGRELLQSNCYTPVVDANSTWVKAVHRLESVGFRINQQVFDIIQVIGVQSSGTKGVQRTEVLRVAESLKDDTFYHRAHLDRRGRMYVQRASINYQQDVMSRALLEFAQGVTLTAEGLDAIHLHISNCYGRKDDIKKLIQWSKDNTAKWLSYADNPIDTSSDWLSTSNPFQLIRACLELKHVKVGDVSHLIVEIDHSCSGLSWQSIVMGDKHLASLANLTGGEYQDLYSIIGNSIDLPAEGAERRSILKKVSMTKSYGAGLDTIVNSLRDMPRLNPGKYPYLESLDAQQFVTVDKVKVPYVKDDPSHKKLFKHPPPDFTDIAKIVINALMKEAPAAAEYTKAVRRFYRSRLKSGLEHIQWLSPSGFVCKVRDEVTDRVYGTLRLPTGIIKIIAHVPTGEIDHKQMIKASLANVIHSLDASLVHMVLANSMFDITPVHDSFGSHASNVWKMQRQLMDNLALIEQMNPSLTMSAQDWDADVTWSDLQTQDAMQDYLDGTTANTTKVVDTTATNAFS
jgi:hypothetical protein